MAKYKLPKEFFINNPLEKYSTPHIFLEYIAIGDDEEYIFDLEKRTPLDRKIAQQNMAQRRAIEEADDPAVIVDLMRKGISVYNTSAFIRKFMAHQSECMPLLLGRYMTSGQDLFIEMAVKVLIKVDEVYVKQLREMYDQIRSPYARACACFVFGQRGMKDTLEFIVGEYEKFKRQYPDEDFDQFVLTAIYQLSGKPLF